MYTALQIRASQWSIAANLWPLTTHIYHIMIIVTGGFSKKSFYNNCFYFKEILLNDLELVFLELLNIQNSFLFRAQEKTFKLMTYFCFKERTLLLHLVASGHRHKIVLSVKKLCMTRLCSQGNFLLAFSFVSFEWIWRIQRHKIFKISIKSSHINFSMIFV